MKTITFETIQKANNGCSKSMNTIIDFASKQINIILHKKLKNNPNKEDIKQDILVKIFTNLNSLQPTFQFQTWVSKVAGNHIIDTYRKNKHSFQSISTSDDFDQEEPALVIEDKSQNIEATLFEKEIVNKMENTTILSDKQKMVADLRFNQGKKYKDIAEITGLPLNSIKTIIRRSKEMVQTLTLA